MVSTDKRTGLQRLFGKDNKIRVEKSTLILGCVRRTIKRYEAYPKAFYSLRSGLYKYIANVHTKNYKTKLLPIIFSKIICKLVELDNVQFTANSYLCNRDIEYRRSSTENRKQKFIYQ